MADIVIIIGNGFDLNLGLKTSYTDFIKSVHFKGLIDDNNSLAIYLNEKHDLHNWIDIENELKIYSKDIFNDSDRSIFKHEYKNLCGSLCEYINAIDYSAINKESFAYDFIKKISKVESVAIFDFNYTESIALITQDLAEFNHIKVHGSAKKGDIIFGIDDKSYFNKSDSFLYKSGNKYYNQDINIEKELNDAAQIAIIGHSLGETDHFYFGHFFMNQSMQHAKPRDFLFTFHSDEGWDGLTKQLMELTTSNLSSFKSINKPNYKEI